MGLCSKVMGIFTRLAGTGVSQVCCVITPCWDLFQLRCQYWDHLTQQAFVFDLCLRGSAGSQYLWRTEVASVKNLTGFSVREAKWMQHHDPFVLGGKPVTVSLPSFLLSFLCRLSSQWRVWHWKTETTRLCSTTVVNAANCKKGSVCGTADRNSWWKTRMTTLN